MDKSLTENECHQLLQHKWSPDSKFKYPVNDIGRRYNNIWDAMVTLFNFKRQWICAYCIAFPVTVSEKNPESVKIGFRDWKDAVGDKRGALDKHSKSERHKLSQ